MSHPHSAGKSTHSIDGASHRAEPSYVDRVLTAPVVRMQDEAATELDRTAMKDRHIGRSARRDVELFQQVTEADSVAGAADADADRAILVVDRHRDHRLVEARVDHAGHGEEQLAEEEGRLVHRR